MRAAAAILPLLTLCLPSSAAQDVTPFRLALDRAQRALDEGDLDLAQAQVMRALERDRRSVDAWDVLARWAEAAGDRDQLVHARHKQHDLAVAQGRDRGELRALRAALVALDPIAEDLHALRGRFLRRLADLAGQYEKSGRPHGAIRIWKQVLALDPENADAPAAIERIAETPDPSLAEHAKPKDLFADVDAEWIAAFDADHGTWDNAGVLERPNYITVTDAGYEVLVRTAEAMEQVNAFYRQFFQYGTPEDGKSVPRIRVHVFRTRDGYLTLGIGPPVEWSGGHFTGGAVETYVEGGFEQMVGTLFHEAAHQFVSLATSAVGWLNEGLASFFEGTRILPNGTVIMNMPANHRLFPLAERMEKGWMANAQDGYDPNDSSSTPEKAPTFRIVIENRYSWGPPWYAPTWGLVFFLYNYQDPVDGRFVYREAFREFINASGGKTGDTAVQTFTEVVLANPKPAYDVEGAGKVPLPRTIEDVDAVWREWIVSLRDEVQGNAVVPRPYGDWGRYAVENGDYDAALEHFEKGLVAEPGDVELLLAFAELLEDHYDNPDRAAKLALEALTWLERQEPQDERLLKAVERLLSKLDPKRRTLTRLQEEMGVALRGLVERYGAAGLDLMVMDVSWRGYAELGLDDLLESYAEAVARTGREPSIWALAYNEQDLKGWVGGDAQDFRPDGSILRARYGDYEPGRFDFRFLTMDRVTRGDFSMEVEVQADADEIAFAGLVWGRKEGNTFHGFLHFPARDAGGDTILQGWVDLVTAYGTSNIKTWRHLPVPAAEEPAEGRSSAGQWRRMRVDVVGKVVDLWFDGELVSTHEFPSREVLYGGFGLVCGPGECAFRNVRFLSRDPRDPAAGILRQKRIEALAGSAEGSVGGSWMGKIPPFPRGRRWAQGQRTSFLDKGDVPQLLVLWSIAQNESIRIDQWLTHLAEQHSGISLEVLSVVSMVDDFQVDAYLAEHPFPGAVLVDYLEEETSGIGEAFEQYSIRRFNMPRVLLLDVDGKVVWEGDPGFPLGVEPVAPFTSYIDDPLEQLIDDRKLVQLREWRERWEAETLPALRAGRLAGVLDHLEEAEQFGRGLAGVSRARHVLDALRVAFLDIEGAAARLREQEADATLPTLIEWVGLAKGSPPTPKELKAVRDVLESDLTEAWETALSRCGRFLKKRGEAAEKWPELRDALAELEGPLVEELREDLGAAADDGDWGAVERLAQQADVRPRLWLARHFLGLEEE